MVAWEAMISIAPIVGAAMAAGGASLAGNLISGGLNFASAKDAQAFAKKMYTNRFQWMMKDMRKAGLNPILAYREAGPGVPSASGQATFPDPLSGAGSAARQMILDKASLANVNADTQQKAAMARKVGYEAMITKAEVPKAVMKEEVSTDLLGEAQKLYNRFKGWLAPGERSSAREPMAPAPMVPDFSDVRSGSSTDWFFPKQEGEPMVGPRPVY